MELKDKKTVRFGYALNEQGILVSIDDPIVVKGKYICPECQGEMIPKKGEHNAYHFAHKSAKCQYNNYLHTIAEKLIQKWYNDSNVINLSVPIKKRCIDYEKCLFKGNRCIQETESQFYDLKKWFKNCEREPKDVEKRCGFRPDLFLGDIDNLKNCIFIEIDVTNPCEIDKRNSGIRIIEFVIENEDDIESIINKNQIQRNEKTRMYNMHGKDVIGEIKNTGPIFIKFYLHQSKKVHVDYYYSCHKRNENPGDFEITVYSEDFISFIPKGHTFLDIALAYASQYDSDLKHCQLCKYQGLDIINNRICVLYKKFGTSRLCSDNNALECSYFRKNKEIIQTRITLFEDFKKKYPVLILNKKD